MFLCCLKVKNNLVSKGCDFQPKSDTKVHHAAIQLLSTGGDGDSG